jgi:hypothetical protein
MSTRWMFGRLLSWCSHSWFSPLFFQWQETKFLLGVPLGDAPICTPAPRESGAKGNDYG